MNEKAGRTKVEIIRHTRECARFFKARRGVYSRVAWWKQENVGEENEKHTIGLKPGWSFPGDDNVNVKDFKNIDMAMIAIRNSRSFTCGTREREIPKEEQRKRDWEQRLHELSKVSSGSITTGETLYAKAIDLKKCAESWEPDAMLLGNVKASEVVAIMEDYAKLKKISFVGVRG